jgi:hypothetical protein
MDDSRNAIAGKEVNHVHRQFNVPTVRRLRRAFVCVHVHRDAAFQLSLSGKYVLVSNENRGAAKSRNYNESSFARPLRLLQRLISTIANRSRQLAHVRR